MIYINREYFLLFFFFLMMRRPPRSTLFPYSPLFGSVPVCRSRASARNTSRADDPTVGRPVIARDVGGARPTGGRGAGIGRGCCCAYQRLGSWDGIKIGRAHV